MTIAWIYLDKKTAAVNALKDYANMKFIINNTPDSITEVREQMVKVSPCTLSKTGTSGTINPHAGETLLAAQIDEIDIFKERYREALEYMEWFRPAWDAMTDDERFVLSAFYDDDGEKREDAIGNISDRFHIERSSVYKKKNRALEKLSTLLYGK